MLAVLLMRTARAHDNTFSSSQIRITGKEIHVTLRMRDSDMILASPSADRDGDGELSQREIEASRSAWTDYFLMKYLIFSDGRPCAGTMTDLRKTDPKEQADQAHMTNVAAQLLFPVATPPSELVLRVKIGEEFDFRHQHWATLERPGHPVQLFIFFPGTEHRLANSPHSRQAENGTGSEMFKAGIRHILAGWDHLAFVAGLAIGSRRLGALAAAVTGFTAGHALTLTLASLDLVRFPRPLIECAIALSILWAGLDNLRPGPERLRWSMTALFGLVHGFGFAGDLRQSLSAQDILWPLFFLNLGVEAGQLAFVTVLWLLLSPVQRHPTWAARVLRTGSIVIALSGAAAFTVRALSACGDGR